MDLFNRLIVTLLAIMLVVCGGLLVGSTTGLIHPSQLHQVPELAQLAVRLSDLPGMGTFWAGAGGGSGAVIGLILLWLELRPRRRERLLILQRDKTGEVTVAISGLKRLADYVVGQMPQVESVTSEARPRRDGVAFVCRVQVKPDAHTPALAQEIKDRISSAVISHVGLPATTIHVHTRVGALSDGRKRVR
jgi:hypothetical protein